MLLFGRSFTLNESGSQRVNVGLALHQDFDCTVQVEDSQTCNTVEIIVDDGDHFISALERVLDALASTTPRHSQEDEFTMLNCTAKIETTDNDRLMLTLKSECGQCVHLSESSAFRLGDLGFPIYSITDKLSYCIPIVKIHFNKVVQCIIEVKAPERQLHAWIYNAMHNCVETIPYTRITTSDIRDEFYAFSKQLFAEYCVDE